MSSDAFEFGSPWQIFELAKELSPDGQDEGEGGLDGGGSDEEDEGEYEHVGAGSEYVRRQKEMEDGAASGYSKSYTLPDGTVVPVSVATHYRFRGTQLAHLSYMEWQSCIEIVAMDEEQREAWAAYVQAQRLQQDHTVEDAHKRKAGAQPSACFEFHIAHPLFQTHFQRLRRKIKCIMHTGKPPPMEPKNPGKRKVSEAYLRSRSKFAGYMGSIFIPWKVASDDLDADSVEENTPGDLSPEMLQLWMQQLEMEVTAAPGVPDADAEDGPLREERLKERQTIARGRLFELRNYCLLYTSPSPRDS